MVQDWRARRCSCRGINFCPACLPVGLSMPAGKSYLGLDHRRSASQPLPATAASIHRGG